MQGIQKAGDNSNIFINSLIARRLSSSRILEPVAFRSCYAFYKACKDMQRQFFGMGTNCNYGLLALMVSCARLKKFKDEIRLESPIQSRRGHSLFHQSKKIGVTPWGKLFYKRN